MTDRVTCGGAFTACWWVVVVVAVTYTFRLVVLVSLIHHMCEMFLLGGVTYGLGVVFLFIFFLGDGISRWVVIIFLQAGFIFISVPFL